MNFNETKDLLRVQGVKAKGYGIIPKIVMQDKRLSIESKAIYSYFCSYAGAGDTAFPSVKKICYDLGISEERYRKHFKTLLFCGYITVEQKKEKGRFSRNIYTLNDKPKEDNTLKTPYTENPSTEIPSTENNRYNINSDKINKIENNQSINQDEPTLEEIFEKSQVDLYEDSEVKDSIKVAIKELYNEPQNKEIVKKIRLEHITDAIHRIRVEQEEKEIKNPMKYFKKILISCIKAGGIKNSIFKT